MATTLPVSVVVPTINRPQLIEECLASLFACEPAPSEVVVVDQSSDRTTRDLVAPMTSVRYVACDGVGIARSINDGVRNATNEIVLVTNDDCTVAVDWVLRAHAAMTELPEGIVTGQVLPDGDPDGTPSIKVDPTPHDFTGETPKWVLYGGNMALPRDAFLAFGGFDERKGLLIAAEDNDLSYRWMAAGRALRYDPTMVAWHHDWRTPQQLQQRYRTYAHGQGAFYAKHLVNGDGRILSAALDDVRRGARSVAKSTVRRTWRQPDEARALLVGIPWGIVSNLPEAFRLRHHR